MTSARVGDIAFEVRETGDGSPILALHGFTGTGATWTGLGEALRGGRRVIAPDLLGHGESSAPVEPARYAIERQADDLAALLSALDAHPADVLGYSMGARLALVLARRHPGAVRRLVLESPSAGIPDAAARAGRQRDDEAFAAQLERDGLAAFVDAWEAQALFASQQGLPREVRERQRLERLSHDQRGLAASLRGAGQGIMPPLHERLPDVGCPALVIAGALDPVGLERAREVTVGLPVALLEVVSESGHAPHLEQPDVFIRLVSEWLATIPEPVLSSSPTQ
jgi:2-succinyl-6-hydroxy-2,4-cyclohexadiene-1-carboxylate synthase